MTEQEETPLKGSARYRLFDVAIALLLAAGLATTTSYLRHNGQSSDNIVFSSEEYCAAGEYCEETNLTETYHLDVASSTHIEEVYRHEAALFRPGGLVEVYDPTIHPTLAFVATVLRKKTSDDVDDPQVEYDVVFAAEEVIYPDISPEHMYPLGMFSKGEKAMCVKDHALRGDQKKKQELIPCTVVLSLPKEAGRHAGDYLVLYNNDAKERRTISAERIRRIMNSDEGEAVEELPSPQMDGGAMDEGDNDEATAQSGHFPIGSVVELYSPDAVDAFPAIVTHVSTKNKYRLTHGILGTDIRNMPPEYVHPYEVYADGTKGTCNVGKLHKVIMVPCTVLDHVEDDTNEVADVVYRVSAKFGPAASDNPKGTELFLPRLRVMRRLDRH